MVRNTYYAKTLLFRYIYTKMGIDPTEVLHNTSGRPVQLVNGGRPIRELFA